MNACTALNGRRILLRLSALNGEKRILADVLNFAVMRHILHGGFVRTT